MRLASRALGTAARRNEGRPVDLLRDRRLNDRVTDRLLRAPRGLEVAVEAIGDVPVIRLSSGGGARGTVLFLHGGAYALGSAKQGFGSAQVVTGGGPDLVSVEYRLAPEHPYPAAVDDAFTVYRDLVHSVGSSRLIVAGESAGGGLLLLLLQRVHAEGLPMPAAAVPAFPWADLSMSGATSTGNIGKDMLTRSQLLEEAAWFAGARELQDPVVSPAFGSFQGFPRTWIPVGANDLLLDDARRVADAMHRDGVEVELDVWPGATHGFTALPFREGRQYRRRLRAFVDEVLPPRLSPASTTRRDVEGMNR